MQLSDRPFQELATDAFATSPLQRSLIVLPTGCGKTITGQKIAKRLGGRVLWLAHRDELITQPAKALPLVWPDVTAGIVKAEQNQYMRHVVFASIQSAQRERRMAQLVAQQFPLVVVDEAHHALSKGYLELLQALGCFTPGGPRLLGLTATPERSDNRALSDVFEGIVFQMGITTAIEAGYLVPPTVIEHPIAIDLDSVKTSRGDYGARELDLALMKAGVVGEIVKAYEQHCAGRRKTIAFVVSVEQAEQVATELRKRGHAAAAVSGEMASDERKRVLKRLNTGDLQCVVNCMVLTEGFDEPSVDAVILGRPTQSKPLMIQKVGRGLRLYPGKADCLVVDMVGASKRNSMVQAAVLFGIKPEPAEKPKAIALDPFTDPEEFWKQRILSQIKGVAAAPRSTLRWLPGEGGVWLLDAGLFGTVRMLPAEESWLVDVVGIRMGDAKRQQLSDGAVTMDVAQAYAEDYVRRVNAVNKALADAQWRGNEATKGQLEFLRKAGLKVTDGLSRGTAADLELQIKAKHATTPATPEQLKYLRVLYGKSKIPPEITKREAQSMIIRARHRKGHQA
jgi:ATP-dependent helicase IRC3